MDPIQAPVAAPPPPPPPPAPMVPAAQPPVATMQGGGFAGFFRGVNWVEMAFMGVGVAAWLFMIKYYRYKLQSDKVSIKKLKDSVDSLSEQVEAMKAKKQQQRVI